MLSKLLIQILPKYKKGDDTMNMKNVKKERTCSTWKIYIITRNYAELPNLLYFYGNTMK